MKIDKKRMKVFKKSIKDISDTVIQIGAIGQHADSDLSNSDLLIIHEFGATIKKTGVKIPARHPIRTGILSNISVIRKNIQGLIKNAFEPKTGKVNEDIVIEGIGITLVELIKKAIKKRLPPPNEDSTLRQKRGDVPLINTSQLVRSITFGVKA